MAVHNPRVINKSRSNKVKYKKGVAGEKKQRASIFVPRKGGGRHPKKLTLPLFGDKGGFALLFYTARGPYVIFHLP